MMINQAVELSRGATRHGSCGLGFGETLECNLRPEFAICTQDLFRPDLAQRLVHIRDVWAPKRLAELGLGQMQSQIAMSFGDETTITRFLADCAAYLDCVELWPDHRIESLGTTIFEAAQGLQLDQDYGAFPYVTRSNTGLKNILAIAAEAGITSLDVSYVTRIYTTRHGAGPLESELTALVNIDAVDPTNAPNAWQGTLRFAPLDLGLLSKAITHDLALDRRGIAVNAGLAVTCLDQAKASFPVVKGNEVMRLHPKSAGSSIAGAIGLPLYAESWGPRRSDVRLCVRASAFGEDGATMRNPTARAATIAAGACHIAAPRDDRATTVSCNITGTHSLTEQVESKL